MSVWTKYKNRISHRIEIKPKVFYEILWVESFPDPTIMGETRYPPKDSKQIVIRNNLSDKETYSTFLHEMIHAMDVEHKIGLTETQVLKLEKALMYRMKKKDILL